VTLVEVLGGAAILLGLFPRLAAALIAIDMLVAVLVVYFKPTFFQKGGIELPITLFAASVALALLGGGAASLDNFIFKPTSRARTS
jgi:putative oxidoreductase